MSNREKKSRNLIRQIYRRFLELQIFLSYDGCSNQVLILHDLIKIMSQKTPVLVRPPQFSKLGRGKCLEGWPTARPEESCRLWRVVVCDLETSWMRRPWPTGGCSAKNKNKKKKSQKVSRRKKQGKTFVKQPLPHLRDGSGEGWGVEVVVGHILRVGGWINIWSLINVYTGTWWATVRLPHQLYYRPAVFFRWYFLCFHCRKK